MNVSSLFTAGHPVISFELFPPKTDEGMKNLMDTVATLKALGPSFVSMTYGAGGSTRAKTVSLVSQIKKDFGLEAVAHLTCVGHTQNELKDVLQELAANGIENVLALRGDPPKGQEKFVAVKDGFQHATQLVGFIRKNFKFCIGVAGYPEKHLEAPSMEEDLMHLEEKAAAGADFIVTQLFFDNADYFAFVERVRKRGLKHPIVPGIMPITDFEQTKRFTSLCGAKIPPALFKRLEEAAADKDKTAAIGVDHAVRQCEDLLKRGAPGIHFYTLNKSAATRQIFLALKERRLVS